MVDRTYFITRNQLENMWIDYSRDKPTMSGQYFVRVKNNEDPLILEYDVQYKDFGYIFSYGQWSHFHQTLMTYCTGIKSCILYFQTYRLMRRLFSHGRKIRMMRLDCDTGIIPRQNKNNKKKSVSNETDFLFYPRWYLCATCHIFSWFS